MKLTDILKGLNEAAEGGQVSQYNPKPVFEAFQQQLEKAMEAFKATIKKSVLGREVAFRGAKGFGQIEQAHVTIVNDVDLVLYQDKYTILFKGTEGRSKKQHEYYIDPTSNVFMKIRKGSPAQDITPTQAPKPKPVVRKVVTPKVPAQQPQQPQQGVPPQR